MLQYLKINQTDENFRKIIHLGIIFFLKIDFNYNN